MLNSNYIGKPYNCTKEICDEHRTGLNIVMRIQMENLQHYLFSVKKELVILTQVFVQNIPSIEGFNTREWNEY